ncbi:MAG: LapA family protein [Alphaproteobacteria bacterium]|nr:LapA family protein [Alphaproteobacteria bacterium]
MTLRRIFNWIVGLPIAVAAVVFAVANRQWITVSFDPFNRDAPFASASMPLWVLFFCGTFVGIFVGWIAAWIAQGKWRKAAKEARIELVRTHYEHEREKRESASRSVVPAREPTP